MLEATLEKRAEPRFCPRPTTLLPEEPRRFWIFQDGPDF